MTAPLSADLRQRVVRTALTEHGIAVGSLTTIWSTLRRLGLSHKKRR